MDGELVGDPAWTQSPVASGFHDLGTQETTSKATSFRMGYDAAGIYVGVTCQEPAIEDMVCDGEDGDPLWDEDGVEVFFSLDGEEELQFVINPMGSRSSPVTLQAWEAYTGIQDDSWSMEAFFPWDILGRLPKPSEVWAVNVCRNILGKGEMIHSTWAHVQHGFHEPGRFGALRFEEMPASFRTATRTQIELSPVKKNLWAYVQYKQGVQLKTVTGRDTIAYNQGPHIRPKISPSGRQILFHATEGEGPGIWSVNKDGENRRRLCDGRQPAWHPDEGRFAFVRQGRVLERGLEGGKERILASMKSAHLAFPAYTQGGDLVCINETADALLIFSQSGPEPAILTQGGDLQWPACSHDGKRIAFQRGAHIHVMELATKRMERLTLAPGVQSCPVWDLDDQGICYAQATDPLSLCWGIYHTQVEGPQYPHRVETNALLGFDWRGREKISPSGTPLLGGNLRLWSLKERLNRRMAGRKGLDEEDGEILVSEVRGYPFGTPLAVETDWLLVGSGPRGLLLYPKNEGKLTDPVEVNVVDRKQGTPGEKLRLLEWKRDSVRLELYNETERTAFAVSLKVFRASPMMEIGLSRGSPLLRIERSLEGVVLPDRFANDIWVKPESRYENKGAALPWAGLTLGLLQEPTGMLVLVRTDTGQEADLKGKFKGMTVSLSQKSLHLGVVTHERMWSLTQADLDADGGRWRCPWKRPFHASWRLTSACEQGTQSRMWSEDALTKMEPGSLPLPQTQANEGEACLVYVYGTGDLTPWSLRTPQDLLLDAVGVSGWRRLSDEEGIRGYRTGKVPFRELATREVGWAPWEAHLEKEAFGALDLLCGLFAANTPATQRFAEDLARDSVRLLDGLDERIQEYESFCPEFLQQMARAGVDEEILASMRSAWVEARQLEREDLDVAEEPLHRFVRLFGEERGSLDTDDIVYGTDELKAFSTLCRRLCAQRQEILHKYRDGVQKARADLGQSILDDPRKREEKDRLRRETKRILRLRFYLEGGWQGEVPLREWKEGRL